MVDQLRMLQAAVEQVGQGVLLAGADGTVWAANAAARRLLGNPPAHLADLLGSDEAGTAVWPALREGRGLTAIRVRGGRGALTASAWPVRDDAGALAGAVVLLRPERAADRDALDPHHLDRMARTIASGDDVESILERTFGQLQPLIGCDNVSLAVRDDETPGGGLRFLALRHTPISGIPIESAPRGYGAAICEAIGTGQPVIVEDLAMGQRFPEDRLLLGAGIRSYGVFPLRGERGVIGSLNLSARRPAAFGPRELGVVRYLSAHLALAVEKIVLMESLERQRRSLEQVLQSMPAGVLVVGPPPELRVRSANARYRDLLDESFCSRTDLVGRRFEEITAGLEKDGIVALLTRAFETGEPVEVRELPYRGFGRGPTHWNGSLVPLVVPGGSVESVIVMIAEVSDQVRDRQQVEGLARTAAEQATALSTIIDSMAEGVFVCDAGGELVLVNQAGARLLGVSAREAPRTLGRYTDQNRICYPDGQPIPAEDRPLPRALRGETRADVEQVLRRGDTGEDVRVRVACSPITVDHGAIIGAVAVVNDVTRTRQLERQREEFLSIAAHELKTPVTSIKLFVQGMQRTLRRRGEIPVDRAEHDLRTIAQQINRLVELVDDMLDVSPIRTGRLEYRFVPADLVDVVRGAVELVDAQHEADGRHRLRFEPAASSMPLEADPVRLNQVVTNLLSNAVKYSPGGGEVVVRVSSGAEPGWTELRVIDQGIGLLPTEIAALFEPFARVNAAACNLGGIGLGLYVSHEIVRRHGGRIRAESAGRNQGSTFVVELPPRPPEIVETAPPGA